MQSPLEQKLDRIVRPVIEDLGFALIMLEFTGSALQISAENPETGNLSLGECETISRALSPALEVEDPIEGPYRLEVGSPGIDRPLVRAEDYERFRGLEAKIEMGVPVEGQKRFRGIVEGEENGIVTLATDNGPAKLNLADIRKARLVMNDKLLNQPAKKLKN